MGRYVNKNIYDDGTYLKNNPTWHAEDSVWKAGKIIEILERNGLSPKTVSEVGCGAGKILVELQKGLDAHCEFFGFEISPQAYDLCKKMENENLGFRLVDITEEDVYSDVLLVIDVIEHLEDYFSFLRAIRPKAEFKIFHIPLELSVQTVLRSSPILKERKEVGHLHYFTKETAMEVLTDTEYDILDYFFTAGTMELPPRSTWNRMTRLPRKALFALNRDLAARIMGRFSLMVLAK